jgi:hypothetical protein
VSVAGCRSPHNARKTRVDEPVALDPSDKSASVDENCLPVTASGSGSISFLVCKPIFSQECWSEKYRCNA